MGLGGNWFEEDTGPAMGRVGADAYDTGEVYDPDLYTSEDWLADLDLGGTFEAPYDYGWEYTETPFEEITYDADDLDTDWSLEDLYLEDDDGMAISPDKLKLVGDEIKEEGALEKVAEDESFWKKLGLEGKDKWSALSLVAPTVLGLLKEKGMSEEDKLRLKHQQAMELAKLKASLRGGGGGGGGGGAPGPVAFDPAKKTGVIQQAKIVKE